MLWPWNVLSVSLCLYTPYCQMLSSMAACLWNPSISGVGWQAVQLEEQSLRFGGGMVEARALISALPLGVPRAYRAALGALITLLGTRPGSAGARGEFLSLTWQAREAMRSASVSSALQWHVSQQLHPGVTAEPGTAPFFCQPGQILASIT